MTIEGAVTNGELDSASSDSIQRDLNQAEVHMYNAVVLLEENQTGISTEVKEAQNLLNQAVLTLGG